MPSPAEPLGKLAASDGVMDMGSMAATTVRTTLLMLSNGSTMMG